MSLFFTGRFSPVFYGLFALSLTLNTSAQPIKKLPTLWLQTKDISIHAEVANTEASRSQGLMYRQYLAPNSGMLFVFDNPSSTCFWMKNTPLPLSIAFITEAGVISNIEPMQPYDTDSSTCPIVPIKYALEMEQDWFHKQNIYAGDLVHHLPLP